MSLKNLLPFLAIIFLAVPVYLLWLWIHAWNLSGSEHPKAVSLYNSYLPEALRGRYTTSLIGFFLSGLAIVSAAVYINQRSKPLKILSVVVIIIASLFAFLNLWSIM